MDNDRKIDRPSFSIVVPLYNHERYIEEALRSVLAQTWQPLDIVLVDDGSSDNGLDQARKILAGFPNAVIIAQENAGAHNAINRAIGLSKGSHIAVLNSDDIFLPSKLERCARLFIQNPEADLVFGRVNIVNSESEPVRNETSEWLERSYAFFQRTGDLTLSLLNENFAVTTSNFVFTRDLAEKAGGFANLRYCHDLEFLFAASTLSRIVFDDHGAPHISYRVHHANTIKETLHKVRNEIAAVIATYLQPGFLPRPASSDSSWRRQLQQVLDSKGLASQVAALYPFCLQFEDRGKFLAENSANRMPGDTAAENSRTEPEHGSNASSATGKVPAAVKGRALNVVIELSNFDRGGLEKVVLDCATDFRRCNVEPLIVSCGAVGYLADVARSNNIETIALPQESRSEFYRNLLRQKNIDISMSHFSYEGYPIFRELGIPNITFIHNIYAMLRDKALNDFLAADGYVDRYISVSDLATDYAVERHKISREKITTIPNGLIVEEHLRRLRQPAFDISQFGIRETDYVFLNVASYNLHKAHYLMADAMRLIMRKRDDIKILCVGNIIYQPHVDRLRHDLEEWGLTEHLLLPGYFEDVAPLHKAVDAFLLPSFIEGWSIAMNEAMFYEKPMILSEVGGAPQVIEKEDIGLLVPNEYGSVSNLESHLLDRISYEQRIFATAPHLANAMTRFADQSDLWADKGRAGRTKIMDKFQFTAVSERYVEVCLDLLKCR